MPVVYRYTFPADGAQYVGSTILDNAEKRRQQHLARMDCNRVLTHRLRAGEEHVFEVLSRPGTIKELNAAETEAIKACARPLNRFESVGLIPIEHSIYEAELERLGLPVAPPMGAKPPFSRKRRIRSEFVRREEAICSICRIRKPAGDFNLDRHRSSGLHSKCRDCKNIQQRTGLGAQELRERLAAGDRDDLPVIKKRKRTKPAPPRPKCIWCSKKVEPRRGTKKTCARCGHLAAKRMRKRYRKLRKAGICPHCKKQPKAEGHRFCEPCRQREVERSQSRRDVFKKTGRCSCGRPARENSRVCASCAAVNKVSVKKTRDSQREQGICQLCRDPVGEGRDGRTHCASCAAKAVDRVAAGYAKRKELGLCTKCGKRPRGKTMLCDPCGEQMKEYRRGWLAARLADDPSACSQCGKRPRAEGLKTCKVCRQGARKSDRKRRAGWREQHRCSGCGGEIEFAGEGKKTCAACRAAASGRHRRRQPGRDAAG